MWLLSGEEKLVEIFVFSDGLVASGVVKKINVSSLEGGLVEEAKLDVEASLFLLMGVVLGSVWRGESQNSWRDSVGNTFWWLSHQLISLRNLIEIYF